MGVFGLFDFLRAKQCVDGRVSKPRVSVVHQVLHGAAQDAFDPAARQIRQAIGREKGETVFNGVLVAQAGGKGRGGLCADAIAVGTVVLDEGLLAGAQGGKLGFCRLTKRANIA